MLPFIAQLRQPIIRAIVYLSGMLFMQTLDEVSVSAPATKSGLRLLLLPLVILAGMGLSVEAGLLGPLGVQVGHLWATLSIFGVGSAILFLLLLFAGPQKGPALTDLPRWQLIGGFLGPMYVVVLSSTPALGLRPRPSWRSGAMVDVWGDGKPLPWPM